MDLQAQADALQWYHTIDLGNGVVTRGTSVQETSADVIPDVSGRSVLDIGAWDGKFSFLAEQAGAARVVALDHYAWGVDWAARGAYWEECIRNGTLPDQSRDETDFWLPDLPGRRAFEFAAAALGSKVEPFVADFQTVDLDELGQFDVVLYLGVLYHMPEPLTCLERVRAVTKEVAVIETEAVHLQGLDHEALLQFYAGSSLHTDFGNWYVPDHRGAAQHVPGGRVLRGAHRRRPARRPPPEPAPGARLRLAAASATSRCRHPRRRAPTTAPSSTPSPDLGSRPRANPAPPFDPQLLVALSAGTCNNELHVTTWRSKMPDIRNRVGVHAPIDEVYDAIATREGLSTWWTTDVEGDERVGGELTFLFGGPDRVAKMEVVEASRPGRVVWRGVGGPDEWVDTTFSFELRADGDETVVLFTNAGWQEPVEFMHHCSTAWANYLLSLKHGLEGGTAAPFPRNELVSSWG